MLLSPFKFLFVLAFGFLFISVSAQTGSVKGTVSDGVEALPGAIIKIEGTSIGVTSDINGFFQMFKVPVGKQVLVISYMGYQNFTQEILIKEGETVNLESLTLSADQKTMDEVVITGELEKGSESKAINMTRSSTSVVTIISSEGISKLPDKNAAETVKRAAGAAIQNNKGEGSFISLRGTPMDWTATLLNGDRLPVADEENLTRSFEFEVLPSELIEYVVISRTVTPDLEGDNIGGVINFITRNAVQERTLSVNLAGGYSLLANKPTGTLNILWGDISKNKKFSYVINSSYYGRFYGAQAYRLLYGFNSNHGINRMELKDYDGLRNTVGINTGFEAKPTDKVKIGGRFLFGNMTDDKYQWKTSYNYSEGSGARVRLQNIHGLLIRRLMGGELNTEINPSDKVKIFMKVATYHNQFRYGNIPYDRKDPRNGYHYVEFISPLLAYLDQDSVEFDGSAITPDSESEIVTKLLRPDNPYGTGDPYDNIVPQVVINDDPDNPLSTEDFKFFQAFSETNTTTERDPIVGQFDLTYRVNNNIKLKFGYKGRYKVGDRDVSFHQWVQDVTVYPEAQYLDEFDTEEFDERGGFMRELGSPWEGTFWPFLTKDQLNNFITQQEELGRLREYYMDPLNQEYRFWVGSKYHYEETVQAGYAMVDAKVGKFNIVGGVRLENTKLFEYSDTLTNELLFDTATFTYYFKPETRYTNLKYFAVSPSLNVTYILNESMNLRGGLSRTFHRPNFAQTKPGYGSYCIEDLDLTFGNANLKPSYSYNFDLTYELFWGNKGLFSVGTYYKYVQDHIFPINTADVDNFGIVLKQYDNADKSYVVGAEANIIRQFSFLPKFWSGFGVSANITYSFSRMKVPGRDNSQAMSDQTPWLYNIALFYERNAINTRLALNYTGAFLKELNLASVQQLDGTRELLHKDSGYDIFQGEIYSLDFQFAYDINKHWTVYFEANNLLNWPDLKYRGIPERPYRLEYYRQKGQVGVKFNL